jgi:hypothetical protein
MPTEKMQEFMASLAKLRIHLAGDEKGTTLVNDTLNSLCQYYKSDPVAREGRYVIENILRQHPHLHSKDARVADWGYEVVVSCDNCGAEEKHQVVNSAVDIATALYLGKHETCKPKPPIQIIENRSTLVN